LSGFSCQKGFFPLIVGWRPLELFFAERSRDRGGIVLEGEQSRHVIVHSIDDFVAWMILFFVRVNQVLVRLWMRVIRLAVRCGVVGILTTGH